MAKVKLAIKESTKESLYQELTKETWNWWIQQFPQNYCYFYLGQHVNIQNLYTDKTKQLFDQKILQQLEHFVGKNNLSTQARAIYQIHTVFQDKPEILFNRAMDLGTTARLNPATTLRKKLGKLLENISTINTIESLSIIQKTQPKLSDQPKPSDPSKPSDTAPLEQPQWK
ncbi:hypothetical protein G9A89_016787 [Geosiphon pyriformis]|nr:hypothetical protein G9A89_016787 [Geosiphon pyriformis]